MLVFAPLALGCATGSSPLADSSPQVELTANPGGVAGHARFSLSLTAWVHVHELGDAATSGQLAATLDGTPLALAPASGYMDGDDHYTATFELPATGEIARQAATSSTVSVSDQVSTWSVEIPALFADDLAVAGPMMASEANTAVWPSAATSEPWSTIDAACISVASRGAACHGDASDDPGISITEQYVQIDVAAQPGDGYTLWAERWAHPQSSGDGPTFFATILDQVSGTFE
ncbi:MAG TPA: hypothetical protein VLX92_01475 [Kofleriaceae bacterium]|nr:hypothetical protein [Kofleriaceae bacterium]